MQNFLPAAFSKSQFEQRIGLPTGENADSLLVPRPCLKGHCEPSQRQIVGLGFVHRGLWSLTPSVHPHHGSPAPAGLTAAHELSAAGRPVVVTVPDTVRSDVYAARISAGDAGTEACSIVSSSSHEMTPLPVSVRTDSLGSEMDRTLGSACFSAKSGNFLYFPSSRESPRAVSGGKGRPYDGRVAILLCDGFHRLRTVRPVTPTASLRVSAVDGLGVANELVCTGRRAGEAGEARRDWTRLMGERRIGHGLTSAFQFTVQAADRSGVLRGRAGTHELARRHNLSRNLDPDPRPHVLSISAGLFDRLANRFGLAKFRNFARLAPLCNCARDLRPSGRNFDDG
jgi:hypothetical protein